MTTASRTLRSSANGSDFSEKLGELRTLLSDLAKSAPAAASETFDDLKCKVSDLGERCESGISSATKSVVKTVKEHPAQVALAAVGAVGAGLLAWWLLSKRGESDK
ncbi:MAG: hypothetical protein H0W78_13600 [Planctomycetes bacterium]|nr:hypothetical protein [Planctomycetota bacterium]